ncbi:MAG: RNA polymerase sigma factor [Myxococcota bacterium]
MADDLEALRNRAVTGDARALGVLCEQLQRPVFRLALRMLGDPRDAEDAAQDILVRVATHLGSFEGRSRLETWVHTIAVRHLLACRKSRAEARAREEEGFAEWLRQGLAFGGGVSAPEDRVLIREIRMGCTQGMLLVLSREERLALVLVDLIGFDGAEAATVAGVTSATLRKRLSRARARLGTFLQTHCGIVNPDAACSCARQVPAKRALGLSHDRLRFAPLAAADAGRALHEMRDVAALRALYVRDRIREPPATLMTRLRHALPTLLEG